ncbi:histidine kinase [Novosphingobium aerophilum]|uniref:hypothetical protein n=1 Tax=Novosphingobium TaxID=165696 RepID=UPI0006C8A3B1|nr:MULTISPECIES: hypothetical protein [unclassified Novosphingobium]KPH59158.1 histidine kinase [Novosphingobium sp. ST904]MPS68823.1 histidine kinase [Novosphingobium sp.]TCM37761.1 hypothetical protein EDF59_110158 [Novosphingobium sp. ST904]WRT93461.1 histidine kinase [Novosphingobium sp. RL4]
MDSRRFKPTPIFRERRIGQCAHITLADSAGRAIDIIVRDVSSHGFSAAAAGAPPPRNEVVCAVMEDGRELWGLVRWTDGNLFGVEFDTRARESVTPPN